MAIGHSIFVKFLGLYICFIVIGAVGQTSLGSTTKFSYINWNLFIYMIHCTVCTKIGDLGWRNSRIKNLGWNLLSQVPYNNSKQQFWSLNIKIAINKFCKHTAVSSSESSAIETNDFDQMQECRAVESTLQYAKKNFSKVVYFWQQI